MRSKIALVVCAAFVVIGLLAMMVGQGSATAQQKSVAPAAVQAPPAVPAASVEWPVLGLVLGGLGLLLLKPRKRTVKVEEKAPSGERAGSDQ